MVTTSAVRHQNAPTPSTFFYPVTPSDSEDFNFLAAIYVGTAGNVAAVREDGTAVTFTAVPAGSVLPILCRRVNATGTTASNIVAME